MLFTRKFEVAAWVVYIAVVNGVGATTVLMERARQGPLVNAWEPFVWEYSSGITILLLIPLVLWLDRRFPFSPQAWKAPAAVHLLATIPFSLLHVFIMVMMRKGVYAMQGLHYDFGNIPLELVYEYRKDLLTYVFILAIFYVYRFVRANRTGASYPQDETGEVAQQQFLIKHRGRVSRISPDRVDWVEAAGNYVILHTGQSSHPLRDTMTNIAERLGDAFCRVHRSTIVNLERVVQAQPTADGDLTIELHDGTQVRCSRSMRSGFEAALSNAQRTATATQP